MADRRMLTKKVTDDDHFMGLSASAQALYLHLSMAADDDGFCNQIAVCMFKAHASTSDLEALLSNRYIYQFDNGVIVIKHWRMANALRKDRYTPTVFQEELAKLALKENGSYTMVANWLPDGCQVVAERLPQDRLGKDREDKVNTPKGVGRKRKAFVPPTLEEVKAYAKERQLTVDPVTFYEYFSEPNPTTGKTWVDSLGNPVQNWKQKMLTWENKEKERNENRRSRSRSRNTLLNYKEEGVSHAELGDIEMDMEEL